MKKYELIYDDYKVISDFSKVYRIKALRNFGDVKIGNIGGYIAKEYNLDHAGNCWVYDEGMICDNAKLRNDAQLRNYAQIRDNVIVFHRAVLKDRAMAVNQAQVYDDACMQDDSIIRDYAWLCGNGVLKDSESLGGNLIQEGELRSNDFSIGK